MRNILASMFCILCLGLMSAYFASQPAEASIDQGLYDELRSRYLSQEKVILKLYFRLDKVEQQLKMKVPSELGITVNENQ